MPTLSIIDQRGGLVAYDLALPRECGIQTVPGTIGRANQTPPPPKPQKKPPFKPSQVTNWVLDWP